MVADGAARVTLPGDDSAPRAARRFLDSVLASDGCRGQDPAVLEDAALLVSELVTNAVRYATPPITLEVACGPPGGLQVRVTDGSPLPPNGRALTAHEESGRGIALVDVISDSWGVEPAEPGKSVWFRLASPCGCAPLAQDGRPGAEQQAAGAQDKAAGVEDGPSGVQHQQAQQRPQEARPEAPAR